MDFLTSETGMRFLIACAVVGAGLAVLAGVLWFLRNRPVAPLLTRSARERRKRLTVVDAAVVDTRRRVVLIRRDNVEHLVMIGGPSDLVIESGIMTEPQQAGSSPSLEHDPPAAAISTAPVLADPPSKPTPPRRVETAMPSEETDFTYGPEAVLSSGRDYEDAPASPPARGPAHAAGTHSVPAAASTDLTEESAEAIISMMRERVLGQEPAAKAAPEPRDEPPPDPPSERKPSPVADSAFARVLDGREEPDDLPAFQVPTVAPARNWAPPVEAIPNSRPAEPRPVPEVAPETRRSEAALELEVARILEELHQKRKS